jgi:phosphate uptake regulator
MRRKINLVGVSTLTVSLPKKWVENQKLKKGDEIDLLEENNGLLLTTKPQLNQREILHLNITDLDRTSILIAIRGAYRAGYDEIHIQFDKQYVIHHRSGEQVKLLSIIHNAVNLLIGAEIISQDESGCIIKDFSI